MKKKVLVLTLISLVILSGCSNSAKLNSKNSAKNSDVAATQKNTNETNTKKGDNSVTNSKKVSPKSTEENSIDSIQKKIQVTNKLDSTINSIDASLKSLDDIGDIDLSKVN